MPCRVESRPAGKKVTWGEKQSGKPPLLLRPRLTGDVDERGVDLAAFGGNEALDEGGAAAAPHPGQTDLYKLQVDAQRVFPSRH